MELWLKGYLSLFFNFEHYGNLNWLAIPLFIYFLVTIKKRKRWEMAIVFVFFLSFLALGGSKGRSNPRYIFTLYPFTLGAIFLFGWELIKKKSNYLKIGVSILCGIAIFINFYHFRDNYKFYWRYKVIAVDDYFPHKLIKFINNIEDLNSESPIMVCSPAFFNRCYYYYSKKKGIEYSRSEVNVFHREGNKEKALDVLKNQLNIKYIYLGWRFKLPEMLNSIISNDCDLVYQEKGGYLYRLRERRLSKAELEKIFMNDSLLRNGSLENWSHGPSKKPDFFEGGDNVFDDMVIREEKEVRAGKYSAKITGDNFNFAQDLSNHEDYKGKDLTFFTWVKTNVPDKYRIEIYDGIDHIFSNRHSGGGDWELLQANYTVNPSAEFVTVRIVQAEKTGKVDDVVYVDGALAVEGDWNTFYLYKLHMNEVENLFVNNSLLRNGSLEDWSHGPSKKPDFFERGDNVFDDMVIREEKEVRAGKYSAKITGDNFNFAQDLSNHEDYKGKDLTFFTWVKTNVPDKYRIEIYDGIDHIFSNRHSGGGDWELLQANYTVNPSAEFVTVRIVQAEKTGKVDDVVYVDGALAVEGDWNTFYSYALHTINEKNK